MARRDYRTLVLGCAISLGLGAPARAAAVSTAPARGLVLIVVDDLRADRAGPGTPRIEAFFRSGAVFTAARSQAPWTLPSALSLLTSLHPSRHGVLNRYRDFAAEPLEPARLQDMRPGARTLAEALRSAGWRTAAFTGGAGWSSQSGLSAGFEVFDDSPTFSGFSRTVPAALRWLDALEPGRRFLLLVHGYDVHPFSPGRLEGPLLERHKALRTARLEGKPAQAPADERRALARSYDAGVAAMDGRLAPLLERLARPEFSDVAVALSADHGEELFERGGVDHGATLNEELLRVPLLLRAPGLAARKISSPVRLVDLMPTLLDLAGQTPDGALAAQMDGVSLRPLLEGRPLPLDSFAETDFLLSVSLRSLVTRDGWKAILDRSSSSLSLYRLADDPGERRDLAPARPDVARALEARLRAVAGSADGGAAAARRGTWKALRRSGRTELYDLSADPYLTRDEAAERPEVVLELAGEFVRAGEGGSRETQQPSEALRRKLREAGYW